MHSDIGLSNVAHHRHFNKSIIISLVIGLFSLLFGMFLSGLTVNADDSELTSPFTYTTNFKNDATYNSSQAINMQFLLAETAGIKPGDKIQISVGKIAMALLDLILARFKSMLFRRGISLTSRQMVVLTRQQLR